jgi:preprotein translocase subunit SecF
MMFSVPNESISQTAKAIINVLKRYKVPSFIISAVQKSILILTSTAKAIGLTSGVSDTIVMLPNGKLLFVEFKDEKGRQSEKQKEFETIVTNLGHEYFLIRDFETFKKLINESSL